MMDITKSQSDFEATFPIPRHVIRCGAGYAVTSYGAWEANSYLDLWKGWLAGRESIEVELPAKVTSKDTHWTTPNKMRESLALSLRTAGIRIKGESE